MINYKCSQCGKTITNKEDLRGIWTKKFCKKCYDKEKLLIREAKAERFNRFN